MRRESALVPFFFLAAAFCCTFEKVQWNVAGSVFLADVTALGFLFSFAFDRLGRRSGPVPRTAAVLLGFLAAFLLVYLVGFFNLETGQALDQFGKGLVKWLIHFAFLIVGVIYLSRKSLRFYWRTLGWFLGGIAFNGAYGILQLLSAQAGHNLDSVFLKPLTRGASQINVYGAVNGSSVYRPNALTGDPNHLGIMLVLPLLILTPLYLRLEPRHRLRRPLAVLIAFLLLVELATLSRSGILGLAVGALVLLIPYRHLLFSRAAVLPLTLVALPVLYEVYHRRHFFDVVIRSRLQTGGRSTTAHFGVYDFVPQVLHQHPFFGLGFNNFSVYYEFVTGKTNWGPHSYYVALLVEGGIVGTALFAVFLWYLFARLGVARKLGRALAAVGDPLAARLRPLAWGMTAALVGTMAANVFYLTMSLPLLLRLRDARARDACGVLEAMKIVRADHLVPARGERSGRVLPRRRRRAGAGARDRGGRRLAGLVPALRDRLRRGRGGQPPATAVAGGPRAADARELLARRAAGGEGRRSRARALASDGGGRDDHREAVRGAALGHRRRARAQGPAAGARGAAAGAAGHLRLERAGRVGAGAGRA